MCFFMFGASLKATNSSFQEWITFCRSIYVKKVMKLVAFVFEHPSYMLQHCKVFSLTEKSPNTTDILVTGT